jgi:outer membrane protein OmpA-like peptidoglycan-associated protein/tetratricopeptide (TPR) repeat protein
MNLVFASFLVLSVLGPAPPINAQAPGRPAAEQLPTLDPGEIRGIVVDSTNRGPVSAASVAVWRTADAALVAGAITRSDGSFSVRGLETDSYYLRVSRIGYNTHTTGVLTITAAMQNVNVGTIRLTRSEAWSSAFEVYRSQNQSALYDLYRGLSVAPSATTVDEVLAAVPSVQIDADGRVSLRGNENVVLQVNGRSTPMRGAQLVDYLKQLPAGSLDRVEVIPNPSGWQDRETMAGIINIVLKQGVWHAFETIDRMREAVSTFPASALYHRNLGVALRNAGQYEEAVAELRAAALLESQDPVNYFELGLALREIGSLGDAVVALRTAVRLEGRNREYVNALRSTARLSINSADSVASSAAEELIEAGLNVDAERLLSIRLDASPLPESAVHLDSLHRARLAQWYFLRGVARYGIGASNRSQEIWDAALSDYGLSAMLDSTLAGPALNNSAKIAEARGRFTAAIDLYRRAAAQVNPNAVFAFNLGNLFVQLQEPDSALARYREALSLDSHDDAARRALIELALRLRPDQLPGLALAAAAEGFTTEALDALERMLSGGSQAAVSDSAAEAALLTLVEVLVAFNPDVTYLREREGPALQRISEHRSLLAPAVAGLLDAFGAFGTATFAPDTGGWWFQGVERFRPYSLLLARLGDQALAVGAEDDGRRYYVGAAGPQRLHNRWRNFSALIPALALTVDADPQRYAALSEGFDSSASSFPTSARQDELHRVFAVLLRIAHQHGDHRMAERYATRLNEVTRNLVVDFRKQDMPERADQLVHETSALYAELGMTRQIAALTSGGAFDSGMGGRTARAAIIGAVVGGAAGAVIGHQMDWQAQDLEGRLDEFDVERIGEGIAVTFGRQTSFDFDSDALQRAGRQSLRYLAMSLRRYPGTEVLVIGHTDTVGSEQYNIALSIRRAESARAYLISLGVPSRRIRTLGSGESEPLAPNDSNAGRQINRRVEIAIFADQAYREQILRENREPR